MSDDEGRRVAPKPEEYSRVTNAERFRPLHAFALALVDRLTAEYDVARTDTIALVPGARPFDYARAPVTLTPAKTGAASVAIAFTTFPSLLVHIGQWRVDSFPSCGCDACRETAHAEGQRLQRLCDDVAAGRFREEITIPLFGQAKLRFALGDVAAADGHLNEGWRALPRHRARELLVGRPRRVQWQAWPRRETKP